MQSERLLLATPVLVCNNHPLLCPQLPRTAQPPPPPSAGPSTAAPSAPGTHALAYSVTALMAAELKRLLADRRQQRKAELEARLAAERRALAGRRSFDLSVSPG